MITESGGGLRVGWSALLGRKLRHWVFRLDEFDAGWLQVIGEQKNPLDRAAATKQWLADRKWIYGPWHFILPPNAAAQALVSAAGANPSRAAAGCASEDQP